MRQEPQFDWNEEDRIMHCYITDKQGNTFIGVATCHEDDIDMMSERTGAEIAFRRARINELRAKRDSDLKPRLAALNQLYYSMNRSNKFNEKSYENTMLQRQIRLIKFDLATINEIIAYEHENLKALIEEKDKFYQQVRKHREKGQK